MTVSLVPTTSGGCRLSIDGYDPGGHRAAVRFLDPDYGPQYVSFDGGTGAVVDREVSHREAIVRVDDEDEQRVELDGNAEPAVPEFSAGLPAEHSEETVTTGAPPEPEALTVAETVEAESDEAPTPVTEMVDDASEASSPSGTAPSPESRRDGVDSGEPGESPEEAGTAPQPRKASAAKKAAAARTEAEERTE